MAGDCRDHRHRVLSLGRLRLLAAGALDADSAITGLMATHISQGRAFPVFWFGQSYMLAVESYLAAPLFFVFGPSVAALKLPLLGINLAIAVLLLRVLERDAGLRPARAILPVLFFALPAPGTAARILEANGGNVEPFLYVVLIWMTRNRPDGAGWCSASASCSGNSRSTVCSR